MTTLITPTQVKSQRSPQNLNATTKLANKLDKLAAGMQKTIDNKLNPAIGRANITPRRSQIADGMREEGRQLEIVQRWLQALAQSHLDGTCPAQFAGINNRKQLMDLALIYQWHRDDPQYLVLNTRKLGGTCSQQNHGKFTITEQFSISQNKKSGRKFEIISFLSIRHIYWVSLAYRVVLAFSPPPISGQRSLEIIQLNSSGYRN